MRPPRKLALAGAAVVGALLLLLVLLPLAFRGRIADRLRAELASAVDADVRWSGVGLGLLGDFPNLTLRLDEPSVVGVGRFAGDTLLGARELRVVLDLGSVLGNLRRGDPIVVRELALDGAAARLVVLEDGTASWDIVRERPDAAPDDTAGAVALSLRDVSIDDARLLYDDRQAGVQARVSGLALALRGDLAQERLTLATSVRADSASVRLAGVPYLSNAALSLEADVAADMRARRFTFTDDRLSLNGLTLAFDGSVGLGDDRTALDLTMSAPGTDVAELLSLVPALYARDFERLHATGRMAVTGRIQGDYGPDAFPALALRVQVVDGGFRYPDLPLAARDLHLDLAIDNPGGDVDSTVVTLERFHVRIADRPVSARLTMRTPVSDPEVDAAVSGSLDLADLPRLVPLPDVEQLAGLVAADVAVRTRRSWAESGQYERIAASGTVDVSRLAVRAAALPHPVAVDTARLRLTPRRAELATLVARVGASDVRASGALDNLLGYALRGEVLRGEATVASERVDLNEWRSDEESSEIVPVPAGLDLALRATAREVLFDSLRLANARGGLRVRDRRVTLDDVRVEVLGGRVTASGFYETTTPERPTFDVALAVDSVDVPTAFASLVTVRRLAPVARYARGSASASLALAGAIGPDMAPVADALTGRGTVRTAQIALEGFPALERLADALRVEQLRNPTVRALQAAIRIEGGRVHVQPFDVRVGDVAMTVSGWNGIDATLDYDLAVALPTSLLGDAANQAIARLASNAGRAGLDVGDAAVVSIGVDVTGTITDPVVRPAFGGTAGSLREGVQQAVRAEVEGRLAEAGGRVDSAADEARRRARAEADRLVAQAEERAAAIREEADSLAARARREARERADALVARASNPAARIAAQAAADRALREADAQGDRLVREAGERADALVAEARRQGEALVPPGG